MPAGTFFLYSYLLQHFLYPARYIGTGSNKLQLHSRQLRESQSLYSSAHFLLDFGKLLFRSLKKYCHKIIAGISEHIAFASRSIPKHTSHLVKHIISSLMSEILVNSFKVLNICKHRAAALSILLSFST